MKKAQIIALIGFVAAAGAQAADLDEPGTNNFLNSFSASARLGFNMSAHFKGLATLPSPVIPRVTPHGDHYNYDDGYVLNDVSGSANGQSWYWGYDNSASQISGNTVLLSRTTVTGSSPSTSSDSDVSPGFEVVY